MNQPKHTMVASQAVSLSELFKFIVGMNHRIEGPVSYVPELSAPDGPSTAGGKQALQHIKLVPQTGGVTLVIGSANLVEKTAELRSFAHVRETHRQRFKGAALDLPEEKYGALLEQIRTFFTTRNFRVKVAEAAPVRHEPKSEPEPATRYSLAVVIAVAAVSALASGLAVFFLLRP